MKNARADNERTRAGRDVCMSTSILWFRRDLRLSDNPAAVAAIKDAEGEGVVPLFVLDDHLRRPAGINRLAFLYRNLRSLDEVLGGRLVVRTGDLAAVVPDVAREVEASNVFIAEDFGPYGRRRDEAVATALQEAGRQLCPTGTNYAVPPGEVVKGDGTPYRVFTPFSRAWQAHGWSRPLAAPGREVAYADLPSDGVPDDPATDADLPEAGESAAMTRFEDFLERSSQTYRDDRNAPGHDGTSRLSAYLKYGVIHPRQVLARLGAGVGHATFRNEICWREFYADVLFHQPESRDNALDPVMATMPVDSGPTADERFNAWAEGRTGFPMVDAGMRQLQAEAYVHNRVRMIVASFLVKDLHIDWTRGARFFMQHLVDGDLASNNHGWQWVAGTGTDAAPYFRVFNPVTQGQKFDPEGRYIQRWVPELRELSGKAVHEPWTLSNGPPAGYPMPIVDHADERREALRRYAEVRS